MKKKEEEIDREILEAVIKNLQVSINVFDLKGKRIFVNPYFYHITGRKKESLFSTDMMTGENKKKGEYLTKKLMEAIKTGKHFEIHNFFYRSRFKKTRRYFDFNIGPLKNNQHKIIGAYSMVKDVTTRYLARKKLENLNNFLEKKILERTKKVEKMLDEKNILVSNVAHEIKTILTIVKGNLEMLEIKNKFKDPFKVECCDEINQEMNRMSKISSDLVFIARSQQYAETFKFEKINLIALLEKIIKKYSVILGDNFKIIHNFKIKNLCVTIDKEKIIVLISNLIENAIKFKRENAILKMSIKKDNKNAYLIFKDNGIGIEEDKINFIFSPFFQADKTNGRKDGKIERGFGLGLAICKKIAEAHGGKILVKSDGINKGTTFEVLLPLCKEV